MASSPRLLRREHRIGLRSMREGLLVSIDIRPIEMNFSMHGIDFRRFGDGDKRSTSYIKKIEIKPNLATLRCRINLAGDPQTGYQTLNPRLRVLNI
jgi:hypothetical protein